MTLTSRKTGHKTREVRVHILVARAFIGEANGMTVNHIDGNKTNNRVENLEYVTVRENTLHAIRHGLRDYSGEKHWSRRKPERVARGGRNGNAKLTDAQRDTVRQMRDDGLMVKDIAAAFGVHRDTIFRIVTGHTWRRPKRVA